MVSPQSRKPTLMITVCACLTLGVVVAADLHPSIQYRSAERGWLYVVTSGSDDGAGRIVIVDPKAGRVVGSLLVRGFQPDIVPSLDGARLFVSYDTHKGEVVGGAFEVIDTADGSVLYHREEAESRGGMGGAYQSRMALSNDGGLLFRFKSWTSDISGTSYWIETFDTVRSRMLADKAVLPVCGSATIYPAMQRTVLFVVCPQSEDVRILTLTASGGLGTARPPRVSLGPGLKPGFPPAVLMQDGGRSLTVIKSDGSVLKIDTETGGVVLREAIDRSRRQVSIPEEHAPIGRRAKSPSPTDWLARRAIHGAGASVSADGSTLFVNVISETGSAILILNALTFEQLRTIPYRARYVTFALNSDGNRLYTVDHSSGLVSVIDVASGAEPRSINVGSRPVFAVVAQ